MKKNHFSFHFSVTGFGEIKQKTVLLEMTEFRKKT